MRSHAAAYPIDFDQHDEILHSGRRGEMRFIYY
jgi:hypothetical protein